MKTVNNEAITKNHNPYWFKNVAGGEISGGQMIYWLTSPEQAVKIATEHNEWVKKTYGNNYPLMFVDSINGQRI